MNFLKFLSAAIVLTALSSCVASKKYHSVDLALLKSRASEINCRDTLKFIETDKSRLSGMVADLQLQANDLKKQLEEAQRNSDKVMSAMHDLSATSNEEAESVKQTSEKLDKKNAYINNLRSVITHIDSLNLHLVKTFNDSLGSLSERDIKVKIENGRVVVDISDTMLFNGKVYTIGEKAKNTLGKIAQILNAYPDLDFIVEGHTDTVQVNTDCMDDNWYVSGEKATAVIRILKNPGNISPERMTAAGKGGYIQDSLSNGHKPYDFASGTRIIILPQLDGFFNLLSKY